MTETKIVFDRLNDFNWSTWRFRMELLLMKEDVWSTVKDPKPGAADITPAWLRRDEKARALIGLGLEDNQLSHVMGVESAAEMWDMLRGYHERGSLSNKIHILRKLCSMRLNESGSMSEHLVEATELVHRLARMGEALQEHLVVAVLLSSLPSSYDPLVTALEGRPEGDLKLDYVKGKLLDEWRRRNEEQKQKTEEALRSTVQYKERRNCLWTCFYCGKAGHLRRNCREWLEARLEEVETPAREKKQQHGVNSQCSDGESVGVSRNVCFTTATGNERMNKERWIIDTGCSKHMTGSVACFSNRRTCSEKVSLPDGKSMSATGCGSGKIIGRGLVGEPVEVRLEGLLFVPGLSGNVLSVSRITEKGYSVLFGPTDCRIFKGEEVIAVGEKQNGLYYLKQ